MHRRASSACAVLHYCFTVFFVAGGCVAQPGVASRSFRFAVWRLLTVKAPPAAEHVSEFGRGGVFVRSWSCSMLLLVVNQYDGSQEHPVEMYRTPLFTPGDCCTTPKLTRKERHGNPLSSVCMSVWREEGAWRAPLLESPSHITGSRPQSGRPPIDRPTEKNRVARIDLTKEDAHAKFSEAVDRTRPWHLAKHHFFVPIRTSWSVRPLRRGARRY